MLVPIIAIKISLRPLLLGIIMAADNNSGAGASNDAAGSPASQDMDISVGLDLGNIFRQCSLSRAAALTINTTTVEKGICTTLPVPAPQIGNLNWEGDPDVLRTFHGGRISKTGRTTNECLSVSYDPRNLLCVVCEQPHHILSPRKPPVLIFTDQNFTPALSGGAENCIAVCRLENPTLSELVDIAMEILDKTLIPPGATLLFGSGSHLYRTGTSQYASDWILLTNRCSQKWPNANICPLIPICRTDCPGSLARDINMLSSWLGRVYANSTTGVLDTWKLLLQLTDAKCVEATVSEHIKIPLPSSISVGSIQSHTFVFRSSCPASLPGLDRKATEELLRTLIETLNRDFSANINPSVVLANNWAGKTDTMDPSDDEADGDTDTHRHIVLIGGSNMKKLVPLLIELGYNVTDLSEPSWLATPGNIDNIIATLNTTCPEPGYTLVMEPFSNSTFRYKQFDGTMAMPFRTSKGYHMGGDIGTCDEDSFLRTLSALDVIRTDDRVGIKIFVPPLPRYLFRGCCDNSSHSTNMKRDDYALQLLQETMRFRGILKNALLKQGEDNFFVLDSVGAVLGVAPGGNRGPAAEILSDLEAVFKDDSVHFTDVGYRYLSKTIVSAIEGVHDGTLTKSRQPGDSISGTGGGPASARGSRTSYFWRGFSSPVGIAQPAAISTSCDSSRFDGRASRGGGGGGGYHSSKKGWKGDGYGGSGAHPYHRGRGRGGPMKRGWRGNRNPFY
jgi:hypothetical protein